MTKDLARTVLFPPTEATAASKLIMNLYEFDFSLILGNVIGL
jgi:hypothetical protein